MTNDLIMRLRRNASTSNIAEYVMFREAADRIDELQKSLDLSGKIGADFVDRLVEQEKEIKILREALIRMRSVMMAKTPIRMDFQLAINQAEDALMGKRDDQQSCESAA